MGKGRKPKPRAVRLLTGIPSHHGYGGKNTLTLSPGVPEMPHDLPAEAVTQWHALAKALTASGLLTPIDGAVLEMACYSFALFRKAEREIAKGGIMQTTKDGRLRKRPWVSISRQASANYRTLSALLGLSPLDRQRIPQQAFNPDEFTRFQEQGNTR